MGFSCGIIGLPNVGKSTIFNALTSAKAAAANFPFCTIEPNTGAVPVPDERLSKLAELNKSVKVVPTQIMFVDIAGLIRGASKGEGLGNQFLGHIRTVDAVVHVVRCFDDPEVVHVEGSVDPRRDIEIIDTELILSDLDTAEKALQKFEKNAKSGEKEAKVKQSVAQELVNHLGAGKPARTFTPSTSTEEITTLVTSLLTGKPVLFVANVEEKDLLHVPTPGGSAPIDKLADYAKQQSAEYVLICGKIEAEIQELGTEERREYLNELGLKLSGLERLILAGYRLLSLITFFTAGPKEARAWTVPAGTKAPQCAGKIHSDFERGFIRAEVISYDHYIAAGSEVGAREQGKLRTEGKDYVMQDGDVVHFRFNV